MGAIGSGQLLDIVGQIYDCVLLPKKWETTIATIQDVFGWHNSVLGVYSFHHNNPQFQISLGVPEEYKHITMDPSYMPDVFALWGGRERIDAAPLEEPVLQSQMGNRDDWSDNKYFQAFAVPQGITDAVTIGLARDNSMVATLTGGRHASRGPFTDDELAGLRILAPHLGRAVTISNLFDSLNGRFEMLSATFETNRAGIILVDQQLSILHTNSQALEMLGGGNPIRMVNGKLVLREDLSQSALVAGVASAQAKMGGRGTGIPTKRNDGSILLVHIFPLKDAVIRQGVASRATAAVIVAPSPGPIDLNSETLSLLYDLTPAECRIVNLLVEGLTMAEAAARLGIAPSTVKTHVLRIYEKTGTHRQMELAVLLRNMTSPW
jgi:DNA-binding CsgD family transcriptional regulator/PAS domain-containing protein